VSRDGIVLGGEPRGGAAWLRPARVNEPERSEGW
jgi:hypothetical protein